jgi:hypothetical protein
MEDYKYFRDTPSGDMPFTGPCDVAWKRCVCVHAFLRIQMNASSYLRNSSCNRRCADAIVADVPADVHANHWMYKGTIDTPRIFAFAMINGSEKVMNAFWDAAAIRSDFRHDEIVHLCLTHRHFRRAKSLVDPSCERMAKDLFHNFKWEEDVVPWIFDLFWACGGDTFYYSTHPDCYDYDETCAIINTHLAYSQSLRCVWVESCVRQTLAASCPPQE